MIAGRIPAQRQGVESPGLAGLFRVLIKGSGLDMTRVLTWRVGKCPIDNAPPRANDCKEEPDRDLHNVLSLIT
jgi:hypothetical protein